MPEYGKSTAPPVCLAKVLFVEYHITGGSIVHQVTESTQPRSVLQNKIGIDKMYRPNEASRL